VLRQTLIAQHPLAVEVLDCQQPVLLNQSATHFVLIVGPAVCHLLVLAHHQLLLPFPSLAAFLPAGQAPLQPAQASFSLDPRSMLAGF
jgi:hypothetical protein